MASAAGMVPGGGIESLCTAPCPFSSWEIPTPPVVTAVTPSRAARGGGTFTIVGDNLFPTLVDAVLLGGNPLNAANFSAGFDDDGNGKVDATVPGSATLGPNRVQVGTTLGVTSDNNVTIDITR